MRDSSIKLLLAGHAHVGLCPDTREPSLHDLVLHAIRATHMVRPLACAEVAAQLAFDLVHAVIGVVRNAAHTGAHAQRLAKCVRVCACAVAIHEVFQFVACRENVIPGRVSHVHAYKG